MNSIVPESPEVKLISISPRLSQSLEALGISKKNPNHGKLVEEIRAKKRAIVMDHLQRCYLPTNDEDWLLKKWESEFGSGLEILAMYNSNDVPYWNGDRFGMEFRKHVNTWVKIILPRDPREQMYCRTVSFVPETSDGKIVIVQKSAKKSHAGEWSLPAGHLTIEEDGYLEGCKREAGEELGIYGLSLTEDDRLFKYRNDEKGAENYRRWYIQAAYRIRDLVWHLLEYDKREISAIDFLTPKELFTAIIENRKKFVEHHAYWLLEYLHMIQKIDGAESAMQSLAAKGVMNGRVKMPLFASSE